jgi:hypothetical protein
MVPRGFTRGIAHPSPRGEDVVRFYGPAQNEDFRGLHFWLFLIQQSFRLNDLKDRTI